MTNKLSKESAETYRIAREIFEKTDLTLVDISEKSLVLFGVELNYDTLRSKAYEEGWEKESEDAVQHVNEVRKLKTLIMDLLFNEDGSRRKEVTVPQIVNLIGAYASLERTIPAASRGRDIGMPAASDKGTGRTASLGIGKDKDEKEEDVVVEMGQDFVQQFVRRAGD